MSSPAWGRRRRNVTRRLLQRAGWRVVLGPPVPDLRGGWLIAVTWMPPAHHRHVHLTQPEVTS